MEISEIDRLFRCYEFRGKRHSIRTLHTALQKATDTRGALSANKDAIHIRPYDGGPWIEFPRTIRDDGTSVVTMPESCGI